MTQVLIAAQLTGFLVWAVIGALLLVGVYAQILRAHRWLIGRGWLS